MPTAATTISSLSAIRTWVRISDTYDTTQDALLSSIGDAATQFIERFTGRVFVTRTVTEIRDGDGQKTLFLDVTPVISISSITVRRTPTDASPETLLAADYTFNKKTGAVWAHSEVFNRGVANVTITYSAGYGAQDNAALPQDIVLAYFELVKLLYTEKIHGAVGADAISIGANTFQIKPSWPKQILDTLSKWRKPAMGY